MTSPEDGPFLIGDNCLDEKDKACAGDADCAEFGQYFCAASMKCRKQCTPVLPAGEYRVAVNDYIASGGSGFAVLKRNTTKFNTGISLREALIDYITDQSQRCDVATYVNLQTVTCLPPGGARGDCTAMCCNDPMSATAGCSASSDVYKGCESMSFQPLLIDNSTLPCLDRSVQKHDGRIQMIGGH
jgi:hypothetical protein